MLVPLVVALVWVFPLVLAMLIIWVTPNRGDLLCKAMRSASWLAHLSDALAAKRSCTCKDARAAPSEPAPEEGGT
jgi:hypothetical protein